MGILLVAKAALGSLGKWLKTPTGAITAFIIILIVALGWTLNSRNGLKDEVRQLKGKNVSLETDLAFERSKEDTVWMPGRYDIDTLWRVYTRIDTVAGKICTTTINCPDIKGSVSIDTTRQFGPKDNPFGIRVAAKFYWPEEYSYRNWMVIDVLGWKESPYLPQERRSTGYAIGLAAYVAPIGNKGTGLAIGPVLRFNRIWLSAGYDAWNKSWTAMAASEILRF